MRIVKELMEIWPNEVCDIEENKEIDNISDPYYKL